MSLKLFLRQDIEKEKKKEERMKERKKKKLLFQMPLLSGQKNSILYRFEQNSLI